MAPLAFWPSPYVALDLIKTIVISLGTLISAILYAVHIMKDRKLVLPPKSLFFTGILLSVSLLISSFTSIQVAKSLIGQGFEIGTALFVLLTFVAGLVAFGMVSRRAERSILIYAAAALAYLILFVFQVLRLIPQVGPKFTLNILNSATATILGSWNSVGLYSAVVAIIAIAALMFLPLTRRIKAFYAVIALIAAIAIFIVDNPGIWFILALMLLGAAILMSMARPKGEGSYLGSLIGRIAWMPFILFIVAALLAWKGSVWSAPVLNKLSADSSELTLPWQMTLDVVAGSIKNYPLFGVGPNHFTQAFLAYKPIGINQGDGWGIEFGTGFALLPTFVATQGVIGGVLWLLFLVFLGVLGAQALRRLPSDPTQRFIIVSSFSAAAFLWISALTFVPSHALLFLTLIMTGIFAGSVVAYGILEPFIWAPAEGSRMYKLMPSFLTLSIVIAAVWGLTYVKKTVALAYFGSGIQQLTVANNPDAADAYFKKALAIDSSDVYWQARAESAMARATALASTVSAQTPASTSQQVLATISTDLDDALQDAHNAIGYDPSNYYNYISEARVSESAANIRMQNAYDNAVQAYTRAIALNPQNPSLYLSLARLQASQNKLDDALKTIGAALQVKNNYLDAIFLLSQVDAAKGNLPEAVTAAQYAIQINPANPLLYFQLGLLQYNSKDYADAAAALAQAVKLQPDYANAQYFLGLSDSRLGNNTDAIAQFTQLAKSNPGNQEVALILSNLQSGKPVFADAQPPVTSSPEKRATLPMNQNGQ